ELEITDLHLLYLDQEALHVELLGRGTAWLDTGTHQSLLEAAEFIKVLETRQGLKVACLEEVAWRLGWLDRSALERQADRHGKSSYGTYLRRLIDEELVVNNPRMRRKVRGFLDGFAQGTPGTPSGNAEKE